MRKGYTVVELMCGVAILGTLAVAGTVVYVAIHFLAKVW